MTRVELIEYCLKFPFAYEDYPFGNIVDDDVWAVMRHKMNKKSFAFIYVRNGNLCLNLKCDPFEADFLRQIYKDVTPAFHMNKEHWNTVIIGGDVPDQELLDMIRRSYDLIKPKERTIKAEGSVTVDKQKLWPNNFYVAVFGYYYVNVPENAEEAIECVLNMLNAREKAILLARFKEYKVFSVIGNDFHVSGGMAQRTYTNIIRKIRSSKELTGYLSELNAQREKDLAAKEAEKELRRQIKDKSNAEQAEAAMRKIKIEDMDLSVRNYHCLTRAGIKTLADIAQLSLMELRRIRNLGLISCEEIRKTCDGYGVILDEGINKRKPYTKHDRR